MQPVRSGTKSQRVTREPSGDVIHVSTEKDGNSPVSTEMQIEEPVVFQEQVEKSKDNSKIKKKTDALRNVVNVDTLKWSKKKQKDHTKEYNLCCNILLIIDGNTDVKTFSFDFLTLNLFYNYSDFSILCSKIATESLRYVLQKGCQYTVTDREIEVFIRVTHFTGLKKLQAMRDY